MIPRSGPTSCWRLDIVLWRSWLRLSYLTKRDATESLLFGFETQMNLHQKQTMAITQRLQVHILQIGKAQEVLVSHELALENLANVYGRVD